MSHPALVPNAVAVITGGASGIGLAAASHFAKLGLKVCIADHDNEKLARAAELLTYVAPGGSETSCRSRSMSAPRSDRET